MVRRSALALLAALAPWRPAAACTPDPCAETIAFVGLEPASDSEVPTDGVLVLRANWFGTFEPQALREGLTLAVRLDDAPVAGALESTNITGVLVWRPAAPLAAAATYQVRATFDNPGDVPSACAAAEVEVEFEFLTARGPALPLSAPRLSGGESLIEAPRVDLDSIVCCDGAYPRAQVFCGIDHGLVWSEGQCTSRVSTASVRLDMHARNDLDDATTGQLVYTLVTDDKPGAPTLGTRFGRAIDRPTCFRVEQRSLATGDATLSDQVCFGEMWADELGEKPQVPALDGCLGELYTCEVDGDAWDPEACTPLALDDELPHTYPGCGCATTRSDAGLLALPLLMLARRRRAAGSAASTR